MFFPEECRDDDDVDVSNRDLFNPSKVIVATKADVECSSSDGLSFEAGARFQVAYLLICY